MPLIPYKRIEIFLPSNNRAEQRALGQAVRSARELFGGITFSLAEEPVYIGQWHSSTSWVEDRIAIAMADTLDSDPVLEEKLREIHRVLDEAYSLAGSPQDAFWITVSDVGVYDDA